MDELADEVLVKELCQKIRNNIAEIKKYVTNFQSLLETYKEKKNLLNSALESLDIAKKEGLNIPVVYNSSGYESLDTLKMLEGYVDIYLPDLKYYFDD